MKRSPRLLTVPALVVVMFAVTVGFSAPAGAWSNGAVANGWGTHDWILDTANDLAGGWVNMAIAQPASDDPDTITGDWLNHSYDVWGTVQKGTAPTAVRTHYNLAVGYLNAGNVGAASYQVALMGHYYADIWNPWHTNWDDATAQYLYHAAYELDVLGHEPSSAPTYSPVRVSDPYAATVSAASTSRNYYSILATAYITGRRYAGSGVDSTTKDLLNRAAEGLADLIYSIKLDAQTAQGAIQQTNSSIVYAGTWATFAQTLASGGSYARSSDKNASVSIPFKGSRLDIYGMKGTTGGIVDFYVDGGKTPSSTVNLSLSAPQYKVKLFSVSDSGGGTHVVTLRPNPASPTGKFINLDYVVVQGALLAATKTQQTASQLVYVPNPWETLSTASASGSSYARANTAGSQVTIKFNGIRFDWIATTGTTFGKGDVYLDGTRRSTVNLAATAMAYQRTVWSTGFLPPGVHTVDIKWNTTNAAGKYIDIDRVDVWGALQ
jgi:hypothetical protein